jgi:hypothetical protein
LVSQRPASGWGNDEFVRFLVSHGAAGGPRRLRG